MQQATQIRPDIAPELQEAAVPSTYQLLDKWGEWMETSRNMAPNTRKLYRRTLEVFLETFPDPVSADVSEDQIQAWIDSKKGKPSTVSNRISALASFYKYAKKQKLRLDNPITDLDRPKQTKNLPKPVEDLEAALRILDDEDVKANEKGNIPRRVGQTRDMAVLLAETGLRIHEAVKRREDPWPVPCPPTIKFKGKGRKDAIIPLTDKAREASDRLEGSWPIGARATQRRFERADFTPHQCRHWRATSMIEAGADLGDVKEMMRHENMQTTLGYAQWNTDRTRRAVELVK